MASGIHKEEFDALVDDNFQPPPAKRKGGQPATVYVTDAEYEEFAAAGFDPRLRKSAQVFHGVVSKILGVKPATALSQQSVDFMNGMDKACRVLAKANGIEVRGDDD